MSRPFFIIVLLTLSLINLNIGSVNSSICQDLSVSVNSVLSFFRQINFYVYKNAYARPQRFKCNRDCNLKGLQFNPYIKTTVIIHGFLSDYKISWIQSLIRRLFMWEQMNIIVVDWSDKFNVNYYQTAKRVASVATELNKFLNRVAKSVKRNLRDWPYIHIIGHSLGAHIAGQAALLLKYNVFVHRITAFDPAKPYFDGEGAHLKLKKWSAQFVDVIHTNGAQNQETFGMFEPLGHMDFYPNGGDIQPKCKSSRIKKRFFRTTCMSEMLFGENYLSLKRNYLWRKLQGDDMICDHGFAATYFTDTIMGTSTFIAKRVNQISKNLNTGCFDVNCVGYDCVTMGMHSFLFNHTRYHGLYYVNTECNNRH